MSTDLSPSEVRRLAWVALGTGFLAGFATAIAVYAVTT